MNEIHDRWDTLLLFMAVLGGITMVLPYVAIPLTLVALIASSWRWFTHQSRSNRALYALLTSASVAVILLAVLLVSFTHEAEKSACVLSGTYAMVIG